MKQQLALSVLYAAASAHYVFPTTTVDGVDSAQWQYIRQTEYGGITDNTNNPAIIQSAQGACFQNTVKGAPDVLTINAGSTITFNANNDMGHTGPLMWFMARVPDGQDPRTWDPVGERVWFKISQTGVVPGSTWPDFTSGGVKQTTTIPRAVPAGDYLLRFEQIALHVPFQPQAYIACAQISVENGGTGTPGPLVAFPGAYQESDQSIYGNVYAFPGPYKYPAPEVWTGSSAVEFKA